MSARAQAVRTAKARRHKPGRYASRRRVPWVLLGVVGAALLAAFFLIRALEIGSPGERHAVSGVGQHVADGQPVRYDQTPPAGGTHWPAPAAWGVSAQPVPDERAVHNLEHGGVVISYNALAEPDLGRLRRLVVAYPRDRYNGVKVLVRPYERILPGTLELAAWGWTQSLAVVDESLVRAFLDAHLDRCCESLL